jgi:hypothetical protein
VAGTPTLSASSGDTGGVPARRAVLEAHLPAVRNALAGAGGLNYDLLNPAPPPIADMEAAQGDERFVTLTGRRPVIEQAVASVAEKVAVVRRGVTVAELLTDSSDIPGFLM